MPSKSKKQERTMRAACHNDQFRKKLGIPKSVACEYAKADKRKHQSGSKKKGS